MLGIAFTISLSVSVTLGNGFSRGYGARDEGIIYSGHLGSNDQVHREENHIVSRGPRRAIEHFRRRNHHTMGSNFHAHRRGMEVEPELEDRLGSEGSMLEGFDDPLSGLLSQTAVGVIGLIAEPKVLGYLYYNTSLKTHGRDVNVATVDATAFTVEYSNLSPHSADLAFLKYTEHKGRSLCLTLTWSIPHLAMENCYSSSHFKMATHVNKTQVYQVNRTTGSVLPMAYRYTQQAASRSDDETILDDDTSETTITVFPDSKATQPSLFSAIPDNVSSVSPILSPVPTPPSRAVNGHESESQDTFNVDHPNAGASTTSFDTGDEGNPSELRSTNTSDSTSDEFSVIPEHEFLDVYPWVFKQVERS
ncbi:hypothetical protein PQX77_009313 [Marasmius sp. AFHP31]|nr:hypothetical protein PQX77_009313 [Marasmius sp. AFHP31]